MKNLLIKPNKENLKNYVTVGALFIFIGLMDILLNTFVKLNFTSFLPTKLSYFAPLFLVSLDCI